MRTKHFSFLILLFLFTSSITAQSLYQDARKLSTLIKSRQYPKLTIESKSLNTRVLINGKEQAIVVDMPMIELGIYSLQNFGPSGRAIIKIDTSEIVIPISGNLNIENNPTNIYWEQGAISETISVQGRLQLELLEDGNVEKSDGFAQKLLAQRAGLAFDVEKGMSYTIMRSPFKTFWEGGEVEVKNGAKVEVTHFEENLSIVTSSEVNRIEKTAFIQELTLLGAHNSFLKNEYKDYRITKTTSDYEVNPYLGHLLNPNMATSYSSNVDNPDWGNSAYNSATEALLTKNYAWQNILYGAEKLDLRNRISIKDVKASYRQEVAPKELLLNMSERQYADGKAFLGKLDATTLVVGVSQFVEERAQEELNIAFLDRFKNSLNEDSELSVLFPNTVSLFNQFEVSNYRTLLENARNSFKNDLEHVGLSFPKLLKLPKYEYLNNSPEIYNLALIYELTNLVYKDVPVDTILLMAHQELKGRSNEMADSIRIGIGQSIFQKPIQANFLSVQVAEYCDKLDFCLTKLSRLNRDFQSEKMVLEGVYPIDATQVWNAQISVFSFPSILSLKSRKPYVDPLIASMLEYNDEAAGVSDYAYSFYKNKITNNLKGVEYYDYVVQQADISMFDKHFDKKPTAISLAANGLRYTKEMIDLEMETNIASFQKSLAAQIIEIEANYIERSIVMESMDLSRQLEDLNLKKQYLMAALESEISWWRQSPNANYYVEAFRNLYNLLSEDQTQWADLYTTTFSPNITLFDNTQDEWIEKEMLVLQEAEQYFKEILNRYDAKRSELYADRNLQVSGSFANIQLQKDSIRLDWLVKQRVLLEDFFEARGIAKVRYMETSSWEEFDAVFSEASQALSMANDQSNRLYLGRIGELGEPDGYDYTTKIINSSNPFRDGIDIIELEKEARLNKALGALREIKTEVDSIGKVLEEIVYLQSQNIKNQLVSFEQSYAKESHIKSRDNATQLGQAMEAAIHILYALKDNTIHTDTIFTRDTTILSYTLINAQGVSVNFDSLRVNENADAIPQSRRKFISKEDYELMMEDPILGDVFLGLLYQRLSKLEGGAAFSAGSVAIMATKFINSLISIDGLSAGIKEKKRYNQPLSFQDYYPAIRTSVDLINTVITTPVNGLSYAESNSYIATIPKLSGEALSLYENIYSESYSNAIYNAMELFKVITDTHLERNGIDKKEQRRTERVRNAILLYGTFMAAVLDANAPEDVRDALRSAALPAGSSRIKRETKYNVALNTYFSPIVALETLEGETVGTPSIGLSVPIGLSFSKAFKNRSSITLFVSGLDIGAVTAFRIGSSDDVALLPELSFKNFVAPGVSGIYNFKNSPFSIGAGWQNGPQLRKIGEDSVPASRWMLHVGIDLPVFNLYSGAKL